MADPINTSTMPGDNMNPDNIEAAAGQIRTVGSNVATTGGDVAKAWAGLKKGYHAPEQDTLFGAMQPATQAATDFSTDLGKAATALETFAGEVRTIKQNVAKIRTDANAFLAGIHNGKVTVTEHVVQSRAQLEMGQSTTTHHDVDWNSDQATVDANNALIRRVNDQQEQLWAAERKCANAIRDLYGASHIYAASESNPHGYGVNDIPDSANMPWGHTVDRKEDCGDSVVHGVGDFLGGMGKGITGLVGFSWDGWHPSWSLSTAGKNLWNFGKVINGLNPTTPVLAMLPGPVGNYYRDSQKMATTAVAGLVGIDPYAKDPFARWKHDPVRTGTTSVLNIASFFIPGGEAGGAADGVSAAAKGAEAAGDAGKVTRGLDGVGDIARVTGDGGDLSKLGRAATKNDLGDLGRTTSDLGNGLDDLGKTKIDVPNVPHDNVTIDHPNVGDHAPTDAPPAREPGNVPDHQPAGSHPESTAHDASGQPAHDASGQPTHDGGSPSSAGGSGHAQPGGGAAGSNLPKGQAHQPFEDTSHGYGPGTHHIDSTHQPIKVGSNSNKIGQIGERLTRQDLIDRGYRIVSEQAQIRIPGTDKFFKPDFIAADPHGNLVLVESKMGEGAKFTPNQLDGYGHYAQGHPLEGRTPALDAQLQRTLDQYGLQDAPVSKVEVYRWNTEVVPDAGLRARAGIP